MKPFTVNIVMIFIREGKRNIRASTRNRFFLETLRSRKKTTKKRQDKESLMYGCMYVQSFSSACSLGENRIGIGTGKG